MFLFLGVAIRCSLGIFGWKHSGRSRDLTSPNDMPESLYDVLSTKIWEGLLPHSAVDGWWTYPSGEPGSFPLLISSDSMIRDEMKQSNEKKAKSCALSLSQKKRNSSWDTALWHTHKYVLQMIIMQMHANRHNYLCNFCLSPVIYQPKFFYSFLSFSLYTLILSVSHLKSC